MFYLPLFYCKDWSQLHYLVDMNLFNQEAFLHFFFSCQISEKVQLFGKKFKVVQEITGYCLALICLFLDVSTTYANGENLGYDFS